MEGETEKEKCPIHRLPPQHWARPKPAARSFFQVSTWVAETQGLGPTPTAFPRPLAASWIRSGTAGTETPDPSGMLAYLGAALLAMMQYQPQESGVLIN